MTQHRSVAPPPIPPIRKPAAAAPPVAQRKPVPGAPSRTMPGPPPVAVRAVAGHVPPPVAQRKPVPPPGSVRTAIPPTKYGVTPGSLPPQSGLLQPKAQAVPSFLQPKPVAPGAVPGAVPGLPRLNPGPPPPSAPSVQCVKSSKKTTRSETFYTYMQTDPANQLSLANQGPHTMSHALVNLLVEARTRTANQAQIQQLFQDQVPDPTEMMTLVEEEMDGSGLTKKDRKIDRFEDAYTELYDEIEDDLNDAANFVKMSQKSKVIRKIRRIMEMHPYGTYAYKGQGASKKARKGKGEAKYLYQIRQGNYANVGKLIDQSLARFKHRKRFDKFLKRRFEILFNKKQIKTMIGL